jgi:hypothetical protein
MDAALAKNLPRRSRSPHGFTHGQVTGLLFAPGFPTQQLAVGSICPAFQFFMVSSSGRILCNGARGKTRVRLNRSPLAIMWLPPGLQIFRHVPHEFCSKRVSDEGDSSGRQKI